MLQELSQALQQFRSNILDGEAFEVGDVKVLMEKIQEAVVDMPSADVEVLHAEVNKTIALVTARQEVIANELHQIRESRKALKGYNHIRGHATEQKLSRTA